MPNHPQTRGTHTVAPAIPLRNLPSGTTRAQGSPRTTTPPTIPRRTPVPSSSQAVPAQQPPVAVSQGQSQGQGQGQGSAPVPVHSTGQSLSKWTTRLRNTCSSSRINAWIALTALGVGAYYFYRQYVLDLKTWKTGLWKDCRDRLSIANSSVCIQYLNMSYEDLAGRSLAGVTSIDTRNTTIEPALMLSDYSKISTPWWRDYLALLVPYASIVGYLNAIIALVFHFLSDMYDITPWHNFPHSAYIAFFVLINSLIASMKLESGEVQKLCILLSVILVLFWVSPIRKVCKARLDGSRIAKKRLILERFGIVSPVHNSAFSLWLLIPVLLLNLLAFIWVWLPEETEGLKEAWYFMYSLSSIVCSFPMMRKRSPAQKTTGESVLDIESQSIRVTRVSEMHFSEAPEFRPSIERRRRWVHED